MGNIPSVRITRFRTAERGWESNGDRMSSGGGSRSARYGAKRVARIERIESVSIAVSGGVSGYGE